MHGYIVIYLSDIKSSDHCAAIYNCCAAIYNCCAASRRNDYFVWMEQLHLSMKLLSDLGTYKCGLILLASVQLSINLILSLSLVS